MSEEIPRPRTRGDCANVPRPCPFVGCRHHTFLEINPKTGAVRLAWGALEPDELPAHVSCSLDVADRGGASLEDVGAAMGGITREYVRLIERGALLRITRKPTQLEALATFVDDANRRGTLV